MLSDSLEDDAHVECLRHGIQVVVLVCSVDLGKKSGDDVADIRRT